MHLHMADNHELCEMFSVCLIHGFDLQRNLLVRLNHAKYKINKPH